MSLFSTIWVFLIPTVYADTSVSQGTETANSPAGLSYLQNLIIHFIQISVDAAFFILTIMLIYAGIRFIISNGDPKNIAAARQIIIQAIIGLVLLAVAWIILLLIGAFTGTTHSLITNFCIGFPGSSTCS